jgi:hypothetical protein
LAGLMLQQTVAGNRAPTSPSSDLPAALLHDMRQLVPDERVAGWRTRPIVPRRKMEIAALRQRDGPDRRRARAFVDANFREIFPERALHASEQGLRERRRRVKDTNVREVKARSRPGGTDGHRRGSAGRSNA